MIKASENVISFIKGEEGFRPDQYDDGFGNITQGFGNADKTEKRLKTPEEADMDLRGRVKLAEDELSSVIKRSDLSQNQIDVLVDMHYNLGLSNMKDFVELVNSRQDAIIPEEILKYNKAFNKHTGQYEVATGLVKRVQKRAEMWKGGGQQQNILNDVLGRVDATTQPESSDQLIAALSVADNYQAEMAQEVDPLRVRKSLDEVSALANPEEALRNTEARRLSQKLGISFDDAKNRLVEKDYNTILTEQSHDIIATHFPAVAEWVNRNPDNYVLLKETGNVAQKLELAARNTRRDIRTDWEKSLDQNRVMLKEALTYLGMIRGQQSLEEGKKILREVDFERQSNELTSVGARSIMEALNNPEASALDKIGVMARNPEEALQVILQNQGSTVAIMGSSTVAGVAGTAAGGPVVGAGAAAMSAYAVSHLLSYAEHMSKQLDEFRDPETGIVDVDAAFADPERVRRWQIEADIYGLTMGAADAAFSLVGSAIGKGVAKHVFKKPAQTTAGKVARKAVEVGAETSAKVVEEGGSQLIASTAVDIHRGDGLKNLKENLNEAENEALLSIVPGATMTTVSQGLHKTQKVLSKASKANEDLVSMSALRQEVQNSELSKKDPEAAKELIEESIKAKKPVDDPNEPVTEDIEGYIDSQIKVQEAEAVQDTVRISPVEFEAAFGSREEALQALQAFGPEIVQEFAKARQNDTSIQIPTAEWVMFTVDNPEIDAIARFGGNELNAVEANEEIEKVEKNIFAHFDRIAYHGSPHNFDKFKESAIERPGLYGHGLYFTEDMGVAEYYRKRFEKEDRKGQVYEVKLPDGLWLDLDASMNGVPSDIKENVRDVLKSVISENNNNEILRRFIDGEFLAEDFVSVGTILSNLSKEEDKAFSVMLAAKGFNGLTYVGLEANKRNYVVFTEDDVKIVNKFYDGKESDLEGIHIIEADPNEPMNLKLRPVELYSRFRSEDEIEIFKSLKSRIKKAMNKDIDEKMIEAFTEIQFRHLKNRAEMLGEDIKKLADELKIGKATSSESAYAHGIFKHTNQIGDGFTIVFAPTAEAKTLAHEFAHLWLHEMALDFHKLAGINPESMTIAQKEYWLAMNHMAQLAGLENIGQLLSLDDQPRVTTIHEKWARTVELYFLEGNIENSNMKPLLAIFRTWMVKLANIIKSVVNWTPYNPLTLTPEVERTIEAILGASSYIDSEVYPLLPEPMFDPATLGERGEDYINTILLSRSNAIGSAYAKFFNKGIKEREASIDKELNRVYRQAEEAVDARRSMILLAGFTDAYAEYKADPEGDTPDPRLSYESVAKFLFNGDVKATDEFRASIPRVFIAGKKKGGMSVETFMMLQDIQSKEELIELMKESSRREELIQKEADAIIEKDFPAIKNEDEIHGIAVQQVQDLGREKLLMKEVDIMMDQYRGDFKQLITRLINPPSHIASPTRDNLKAAGLKVVLDTNAYGFSAGKFLNDSLRHGKDAAKKFRKNNIIEAIEAKIKEATHFFAYKTARKAEKAVAKTTLRIKQFSKYARSKDILRKFDADMMEFGKQVIQLAGYGQEIPHLTRDGFHYLSGVADSHIAEINRKIDKYSSISKNRAGKNVSVEGYLALGELLDNILLNAAKAKQIEIGNRIEQIDAVAEKIVADVREGNVVDVSGDDTISSFRNSTINLRTMFESLYSSPEAFSKSALGKIFYKVADAESLRAIELQKYKDRISKAVKATVGDAGFVAPIVKRLPFASLWGIDKNSKPIMAVSSDGFSGKLMFKNKGELHMAMLLMGSESGSKKFLMGHKLFKLEGEEGNLQPVLDYDAWNRFTERLIREGVLTRKDFEMYETIWKTFDEIHPMVKDAMRRSDHFNMGYIEGWTVKNSLGEFQGGYVPVAHLSTLVKPQMTKSLLDVDTMGYQINELYPSMNTGMTNERTDDYSELNLDMSRLFTYLSAALNIAYLRNPLLDFGKILEQPEVRQAIEGRRPGIYGNEHKGMIIRWFNAVRSQEYTEYSTDIQDRVARTLRMNVNLSMYLGSWTTVIKQFFGFVPAIARVGAHNLMVANVRTGFGAFKQSRQVMMDKSVMMRSRLANSQEQMIRSWDELDMNFDWISWSDDKVKSFQWLFIQMTQNMVDTATWHAAYAKAKKEGMQDIDAVHFADDAVRTTQSSPEVSNLANIQRGKDSYKLLMMVTSVPIAMNNMLQAEMLRDQTAVNRAKAVATIGLLGIVLPGLLDAVFGEVTKESDEDEEKTDEEKFDEAVGLVALRTAVGSFDTLLPIPYTRIATSTILFMNGSASPGLSKPASSIAKGNKGVQNLSKGVDLTAKEWAGIFDTVTVLTGLPSSIVGKVFTFHDQFIKDDEEKEYAKYERRAQLAEIRESE